ncbi:hypothetical protein TIFTF001_016955 [Ficus carica]|uniref:Uncharacterized protein n=1 Tax=Ficus carica TaxID=3494 RepID=A0AA88D984_FICCA|nr:hypothetical protein TIFTF001_016955 [Ficus carica]
MDLGGGACGWQRRQKNDVGLPARGEDLWREMRMVDNAEERDSRWLCEGGAQAANPSEWVVEEVVARQRWEERGIYGVQEKE